MATHLKPVCFKALMREVYTMNHISGTPGNYQFSGPVVIFLQILREHLGICLDFVVTEEQIFGVSLPNGSWTGMIGMVQRHEVDFSGNVFTMNYDTLKALEFSESIYTDDITGIYIRPRVSPNIIGFIMPYTALVWFFMMMTCVVLITVIMVTARFQRKFNSTLFPYHSFETTTRQSVRSFFRNPEQSKIRPLPLSSEALYGGFSISSMEENGTVLAEAERSWFWSHENSILWTWSTLIGHSMSWQPMGDKMRCMAGMWLLAAYILGHVYRSNLKAMLTIPRINILFDNVDELAESDVPIAILKGSKIERQILAAENSSTLGRMKDQIVNFSLDQVYSTVAKIFEGEMAGMNYRTSLSTILNNHYSKTGKCGAYLLSRGFLGPSSLSLIFPKGSHLKEKFNPVILRLKECGLLAKIMSKRYANATECLKPLTSMDTPSHRPLQLLDFYGILAVYFAGVKLAAMTFLWEVSGGGAAIAGLQASWLPHRVIISLLRFP